MWFVTPITETVIHIPDLTDLILIFFKRCFNLEVPVYNIEDDNKNKNEQARAKYIYLKKLNPC